MSDMSVCSTRNHFPSRAITVVLDGHAHMTVQLVRCGVAVWHPWSVEEGTYHN